MQDESFKFCRIEKKSLGTIYTHSHTRRKIEKDGNNKGTSENRRK